MFIPTMAKTDMLKFWEYLFESCGQEYTCVLGWIVAVMLAFLALVLGLVYMMNRLINKKEE